MKRKITYSVSGPIELNNGKQLWVTEIVIADTPEEAREIMFKRISQACDEYTTTIGPFEFTEQKFYLV